MTLGGDLEVRRLGFGAMRITGDGHLGPAEGPRGREGGPARAPSSSGVNFIDTADSYGPEVSEELIAEALHPYPGGLVIATKGGLTRSGPGQWERDGRPEHLREACEGSLRRLRLERIDLYQLHAVDPEVPLEESVGALVELRDEGKIGHVGLSNVDAGPARPGPRDRPDRLGAEPLQHRRPRVRAGARGVRATGDRLHPLVPAWRPETSRAAASIGRIAEAHDATPFQVALAWLLARSPVMLPIPGTSSVEHLEENVAAAGLRLAEDEFEELFALGG